MRKSLVSMLLLVLLLPILAACGTSTTTTSTPAVESPSVVASESAMASESAAPSESAMASESAAPSESAMASESAAAGSSDMKIALVTDVGKVNDGTFNQFAYEGLVRAQKELGVQVDYIETQNQTDYDKNLEQFASQNYDLIIGVGFLMGDAVKAVASRHPDRKFAIVDFAYGDDAPANVKGLVFNEDESGYIAGTIAALVSKSNNIGVVGGLEVVPAVKKFVRGYEAGAKAQKSDITVQPQYTDSFTDPAKGAEIAKSMIAEGADVIFGAGGQTGSGAIQEAAKSGAFAIGVDQDEYNTTFRGGSTEGADKLVSSAIKRVDNAVFDAIKSVVDGNFSNELYVGTVANGGIDYAECHDACDAVTAEIKSKVDEVKNGLGDGSIKTNVTLE